MNLAEFRRAEDYGKHAGLSSAEIAFVQQGYLVQSVTRLTNDLVDRAEMMPSGIFVDAETLVGLDGAKLGPIKILPPDRVLTDDEQEMLENVCDRHEDFINENIFLKGIDGETGGRLQGRLASIRKKLNLKER